MRSRWQAFDVADRQARCAHAGRLSAIAALLVDHPVESLVSMIAARSQVTAQTARGWVREAAELRGLPDLMAAYTDGMVSGDRVAALRVLAEPGSDGAWVEALELDVVGDHRIGELTRQARRKRARELERTDGGRFLRMRPTRDERWVDGRFRLHPEEAAEIPDALDRHVPAGTPWHAWDTAYADALLALVRGERPRKATVVVHSSRAVVDGSSDEPGRLANGNLIPAQTVRELARTGRVIEAVPPETVTDTDDIPEPVRRYVWARDEGRCVFPDCTAPADVLEIHHITPRSRGGSHHPSNLVLLCWGEHQVRIHRQRWSIRGDAEVALTWHRPDGSVYVPPSITRARAP